MSGVADAEKYVITKMTIAEFHAAIKSQGVPAKEHIAFVCPICRTVQTPADLIRAGAGATYEEVEKYIAYSCIGRWTGAGGHRRGRQPGQGCDWTLGGFLQLHEFVVIDEDGKEHPRFAPASPAEAQAHLARRPQPATPPQPATTEASNGQPARP